MAKMSRRPGRERRKQLHRRRAALGLSPNGLKLVIATGPGSTEGEKFLQHDLQMVRSALLYADSVELLSPVAIMLEGLAALQQGDVEAWANLLLNLDEDTLRHLGLNQDVQELRYSLNGYLQLRGRPRAERRELLGANHANFQTVSRDLRATVKGFRSAFEASLDPASRDELNHAIELGALTLNWGFMPENGDSDKMIENYAARLKQLLESPSTHLLLDEMMGSLAKAMINEGRTHPEQTTLLRSARSRVGTGLVSRLPAFPHATVPSVLETRVDIREPLAKYRAGVSHLAEKLQTDAIDPAAEQEVEELWRDKVQPTLSELREDLSRTRLFRETVVNLGTDSRTFLTGAGIFAGLEALTDVESLVAAGAGTLPIVSRAVATAIKESDSRRRSARRHELFYLLELDRRLDQRN